MVAWDSPPQAIPILPTSVNPNVRAFLSIHQDLFPHHLPSAIDQEKTDRLIVVDAGCWSRLEGLNGMMDRRDLDIHLWDHHAERGDIQPSWSCLEPTGAAVTLLVQAIRARRMEISVIQATLFLAGIYEDTGNLTFPSTTPRDAKAVGFLLDHQADLSVVRTFLRPAYGPKQKDILFEMLKDAERTKVNGFRVSVKAVETTGHTPGLSVVVEMYQEILKVDAVFGIFIDRQRARCMVIGRSAVEGINVSSIMRSMGGGGHPGAGSAVIKSANPVAVEDWIMELLRGNQQASVQISDLTSFPVLTVSSDTPIKDAALFLIEKGYTGLPVIEEDRVVGILSRKDFKRISASIFVAHQLCGARPSRFLPYFLTSASPPMPSDSLLVRLPEAKSGMRP